MLKYSPSRRHLFEGYTLGVPSFVFALREFVVSYGEPTSFCRGLRATDMKCYVAPYQCFTFSLLATEFFPTSLRTDDYGNHVRCNVIRPHSAKPINSTGIS
jgi:hypothetical protein